MTQPRISRQQVKETARMAGLIMSDHELTEYNTNMSNFLDLVAQIETIDTDNVDSMAHPLDLNQQFHDPDPTQQTALPISTLEHTAPQFEQGYFLVPKVVDKLS